MFFFIAAFTPTSGNTGSGILVAAIVVPVILLIIIIIIIIISVSLFINKRNFKFDSRDLALIKTDKVKIEKLLSPASECHSEIHLASVVGLSEKDLKVSESDAPYEKKVVIKKFKKRAALIEEYKEYSFIAKNLRHTNIALALAFCTEKKPFLMLEYMEHRDLNTFMKNTSNVSKNTKLKICKQIADAMEHINGETIHCNLTSENCLVGDSKDGYVVKVSDFRLCNVLRNEHFKFTKHMYDTLSLRWMAPECFSDFTFTRWTDRWAFGVVMWEVFTHCKDIPYQELKTNQEVIKAICDGKTLPRPDNCKDKVFNIMKSCWNMEPKDRPIFRNMSKDLS